MPKKASGILTALAAGVLCLALVGGPLAPAQAQDLNGQKTTVQGKISDTKKAQSAAEVKVVKANQALADSQKKLTAAQADLANKQQATATAQAADQRAASDLASAEQTLKARQADLTKAQAAVADGEAKIAAQRDQIGLVVQTATQQNTTLLSVSMLFTDFNTAQINDRMQWAGTVFAANQDAMESLTTAQTQLVAAQASAKQAQKAASDAQAVVADKRAATAAQLSITKQAQLASKQAQDNVAAQVSANTAAKAAAQKALNDANAEYNALQKQLNKIEADIRAEMAKQAAADKASGKKTVNQPAPSSGAFFYRPVPGAITSPYGMRFHPILHIWKFHSGVDLHAGCGTPIHAAASGTVSMAQRYGGYGNFVRLSNGKIAGATYGTGYAHMSKILVHKGQKVSRGQVIGLVGTTGMSTGCHLHFEVYKNGSTVNPAKYI